MTQSTRTWPVRPGDQALGHPGHQRPDDGAAREAVAGWFSRRGHETSADQVLLAPGSKALLYALVQAFGGPVVMPQPSWVSYSAQAELVGVEAVRVPIGPDAGGIPAAGLLRELLETWDGPRRPGCLILTVPDNPTGTVGSPEAIADVCRIAREFDVPIVADEIYGKLIHEERAPSALDAGDELTVVTTGLSKSVALGGWRIGVGRVPDSDWGRALTEQLRGIASEVWSALAGPMQAVVEYVYSDPEPVREHIDASRRLHGAVVRAVWAEFDAVGAACRPPTAGFHLYPDLEPLRERLAATGIHGGTDLTDAFLSRHGIGFLPGVSFGAPEEDLTLRVATSLLYGVDADQRWASLRADDPVALPWVQESLAHLRAGLEDVVG